MKRASRLGLIGAALLGSLAALGASSPSRVTVTILQTSDLHGHLLPWDYAYERPSDDGLARVATRIAEIRKATPNVLVLDAGDTIQGTPVEYLHAKDPSSGPDPMAAAMSAVRYDAMAVGNHEFNFGLDVLRKAEKESSFPWLSANTRKLDGSPAFPEYVVKTVGGVRVGILGLITPNITGWEPEQNRPGLKWEDPEATAARLVPVLRAKEKCDLVVVLVHSGPEVNLKTLQSNGTEYENRVAALTKVPGIDLLLTGHTHEKIPLTRLNGVPFIQPGRWGEVLARVDVTLEKHGRGFRTVSITGELLPSDKSVESDPEVARIAAPHDTRARAYMDESLATSDAPFPAAGARLGDSALLELVSETMRAATKADLSMASLLPGGRYAGLPAGTIKVRDVYALYPYENQLVVVEVDGAAVKSLLEHAAEFYGAAAWSDGRLVLTPKPGMVPYNFDAIEGVEYRIDPTAPVGSRVKDLAYKGAPMRDADRFTMAVNSYRAQGAGGYRALKGSKVVRVYSEEIRELLIGELKKRGRISPRWDHNWVVAPDAVWTPDAFAPRTN